MQTYFDAEIPATLNGYPVKATSRLKDRAIVILHRETHALHPWIVASWWPELQNNWQWSHCFENWQDADEARSEYIRRDAQTERT